MNGRERFLETILFGKPDKVPFSPGGPRESTLKAWHQQGLPEEGNWFDHLREIIGVEFEPADPERTDPGVSFLMIPQFEEKVIERRPGTLVVQDWKGNICEISDEFDVSYLRSAKDFVTRRWIKCPVENRDDWEEMKRRYDPTTPERYGEDFEEHCRGLRDRGHVLRVDVTGPFWQKRE